MAHPNSLDAQNNIFAKYGTIAGLDYNGPKYKIMVTTCGLRP